MKKILIFILAAVTFSMTEVKAQNIQVMYDTERGCVTSTV